MPTSHINFYKRFLRSLDSLEGIEVTLFHSYLFNPEVLSKLELASAIFISIPIERPLKIHQDQYLSYSFVSKIHEAPFDMNESQLVSC